MTKVIKGGTVCTADRSWKADVLIEGETIKQIGENLSEKMYALNVFGGNRLRGGADLVRERRMSRSQPSIGEMTWQWLDAAAEGHAPFDESRALCQRVYLFSY